jgi:hypothetical protein
MSARAAKKKLAYTSTIPWLPQEGPQEAAMFSKADVLLYGGAAGGGKTSLACGLAITRHEETLIMRREATQMKGIIKEISRIADPLKNGLSRQHGEWRIPPWDGRERMVMLGSCPNLGDENKWQGIARDLLVLDEAVNFLYEQVVFLMGWTRSVTTFDGGKGLQDKQRTRVILCSNPPTNANGYWVIEMFSPWLDPMHPNPAEPGELRWYTTLAGVMTEVANGDPIPNPQPIREDDQWIYPKSFTFIPAKVQDNKYLDSEYIRELQAMPEPLRSQFLLGDFMAAQEDSQWQVIPSAWVDAAFNRWEERPIDPSKLTSVGVDPSRGGKDETIIAPREDWYFHKLIALPGYEVPTGNEVAKAVIEIAGQGMSPIHVDSIGIGAAVIDALSMHLGHRVVPMVASERATEQKDMSGSLKFTNKRAQWWWRFRDLLNPASGKRIALPPDQQLKAELCAPTYDVISTGIKIESKKDIIRRLGRSTDRADAVIMAAERTAVMSLAGAAKPRFAVKGALHSTRIRR